MVFRSLFWRIFATFWLAILSAVGLTMLLGHLADQDSWILAQHPGLRDLPEQWVQRYENEGPAAAQGLLEQRKGRYGIDVLVLGENGSPLVRGTLPPRIFDQDLDQPQRQQRPGPGARDPNRPLPWRRLTDEYASSSGQNYLFIYHLPTPELGAWRRQSLFWPVGMLAIATVVLTLFSLLLTLSLTRPLNHLRRAVHDLGQTAYQQDTLARLARRKDELGVLAGDFNRMGAHLQRLIDSQRQLLRDVSHELRSPLARLRIALALAERSNPHDLGNMWPRLTLECDRLETLIGEILALARQEADPGPPEQLELHPLLEGLVEDAQLSAPQQRIELDVPLALRLDGWPDVLERALDNLLRNALRFNPPTRPIIISAAVAEGEVRIQVRDHGPGVRAEDLPRLGEPFFRSDQQQATGYGLGLAIARRAVERHGGELHLSNHPDGGFLATVTLPLRPVLANG